MATIGPVEIDNNDQTRTVSWQGLGNADSGLGMAFAQFPDRTLCGQGTWGGATMTFQGSMDGGTTWFTLTDHLGNTLVWTANAIALVAENPTLVRPITSGGSGTSLNVYLVGTRA